MEFDFSQNTTVPADKFSSRVPEDFRGLYKEDGDNYVLDSEHDGVKSAVAAVTRLNKALNASRGEAKDLKSRAVDLSALSDYGSTVDEIAEGVQAKMAEAKKAGGKNAEDLERQVSKVREELAKAHASDLESRDKRIEALTGQLHSVLVREEAVKALADAGAVDADLAMPHVISQVKVAEEDGEFKVLVVDGAGDPRYSGTGEKMTIRDLVKGMKDDEKYGVLFKSDSPRGGGTPPGVRRPAPGRRTDQPMSSREKIAAGLAKGQARPGK